MRDPRMDPKRGDVLRKHGIEREVISINPRGFVEVANSRRFNVFTYPWLSQWRKWAADAEVIHAAE